MPKLSRDEVQRSLADLPGWSVDKDALVKSYKHQSFAEAIVSGSGTGAPKVAPPLWETVM